MVWRSGARWSRAAFLMVAWGCGGKTIPVDEPAVDTDLPVDSDGGGATDTPVDSGEEPVEETGAFPQCAPDEPEGRCAPGQSCVEGFCQISVGEEAPYGGSVEAWTEVVAWAQPLDLLTDRHPVTWSAVDAEVRAALGEATTEVEAAWAMNAGFARFEAGHIYLDAPALCGNEPDLTTAESDSEACVVEVDGRLWVYAVAPGSPWQLGDELLDISGRDAATLVADRLAQPRCLRRNGRAEVVRHAAVASLLRRGDAGGRVRVRREGATQTFALPRTGALLQCAGRLDAPGLHSVNDVVKTAWLDGGVFYLRLDALGTTGAGGFEAQPVLDAMYEALSAISADTPLVVDLRGNIGGYPTVVDTLAGWLLPPNTPIRTCRELDVVTGAARDLATITTEVEPMLQLTGEVAVLVDASVYGAAEYLPMALVAADRAQLVGAPIHGSAGISYVGEVAGLRVSVEGRRCEAADGSSLEGVSPSIDHLVPLDSQDLRAGVDTVIEAGRRVVLGLSP